MCWRKLICLLVGVGLLAIGFSSSVFAYDKQRVIQVKVQAPLDAINYQATPATISLLGLTIDINKASFGSGQHHEQCANFTCANLTLGQVVVVELVSVTPDPVTGLLTATEIEVRGGHDDGVKIAAPLQVIDPSETNVTVLGLLVDISTATLLDDNVHFITASQLVVGQFVDLDLASNQTPLSATLLVAESGINAVHVFVMDEKGKPVKDVAADVKAVVTVTVAKKVLKIQTTSNGAFDLAGLPAGRATIVVTRVYNGRTSKATASFQVKANVKSNLSMKLKIVR